MIKPYQNRYLLGLQVNFVACAFAIIINLKTCYLKNIILLTRILLAAITFLRAQTDRIPANFYINITEKTGIKSLSGLTIYAITKKIIPLDYTSA
jgi:hypothetical protein